MKEIIERGTTSVILHIEILDSTSTTGGMKTGLAYDTASIACRKIRSGETLSSAVTIEDITTLGTYQAPTSNAHIRFKEVDSTNWPGLYEIHIHNDWLDNTNSRRNVKFVIRGATGMVATSVELQLADPVRGVGSPTALPNAAAEAAGGLYTRGTGAGQINQANNGQIDVNTVRFGGTTQTARDIGASVLLSPGTGAGQLDITSGIPKANVTQFGGVAGAFTSGRPEVNMTHAAGTAWGSGGITSGSLSAGAIAAIQSGLSTLTQADIRTAIGLASADLDTQLSSLATNISTLLTRLSSARAGYLDNLNVGGLVASSAEATSIQNNTRVVRIVPSVIERPDSGSTTFRIEILLYDSVGNMEAPDSAPTIAVINQAGTSRNANLDSTTMSSVSTGRYVSTYTVDTNHAIEELVFTFSVIEGGATRTYGNPSFVVDTTAVDFTSSDRTTLNSIVTTLTNIQGAGWSTETLKAIYDLVGARLPATLTSDGLMRSDMLRVAGTLQSAGNIVSLLTALVGYVDDIGASGAGLTAIPWNSAWDAEVQSEVADAIEAYSLQYLFHSAYSPTSKPGDAAGLLNRLVQNDGGIPQFTANALELAPSGGGGGGGVPHIE